MENEIRLGKVSSVNYTAGMVRVVYHEKDDSVTREIPMLSDEYNMPAPGDMVLVLHLSNGTEAGVVLGRPWSEKNKPPEGAEGLYRKDLARTPGEAMIRYQGGVLTIKAAKVVIDGDVTATGKVDAVGDVTGDGISLDRHTHTDSVGGSTSTPT